MEMRESAIRERFERGPSGDRGPSRKNSLLAGIVAGAVAVAGIAALWQLDRDPAGIGDTTVDLPTLVVTFQSGRMIVDQPDEQIQRVDTTIVYGDAREESFTSTISESAHVDWVGVEDLTRFLPGPTAGSQVRFDADGDDARVLIGHPGDWPEFDRFTEIDRLPVEPGEYVLLFEATYAEGIARTAWFVRIVEPGVVQLVANEGGRPGGATAAAYLDGRRTDGFLSTSWFMEGDLGGQAEPLEATFEDESSLRIPSGTPLLLASEATEAHAGLLGSYDDFNQNESLPIDLSSAGGSVEGEPGRHLLAVDLSWLDGRTGYGQAGTEERAIFFFSVEIVSEQDPLPPPSETPSPEPGATDVVTIDIQRSSEETGDPEAIARFGSQEQWMCPDGWSVVNPDGTTDEITFDCGQDDVFEAPVGTPIEVAGDFATLNVSAGVTGNDHPGTGEAVPPLEPGTSITLGYEVTWEDGSEASFWLLLTVEDAETAPEEPGIVVRVYGLGERSYEQPTATFSFGGQTRTACTQDYEWTKVDGTTIREQIPDTSVCDGRAIEVPPGTSIAIEAATTTRVVTTRTTTQFFEGDVGLVVSAEWPEGNATFVVPLTVTEATPDLELVVLDCRPEDHVPIAGPDARIEPGGSAYIVGNLPGFEQSDVVEQMTREQDEESDWAGVWQVVRDGSVVASVDYPDLSGAACAGTGIGGA
jgi:hypothetical protein